MHERVASGATPAKGAAPAEVVRVERIHHNSRKLLTNSQFHLHRYSKTSSVKCSETVEVFLKNTAVGDVVFWELDNFKKRYDYGDIPPVCTADIIRGLGKYKL